MHCQRQHRHERGTVTIHRAHRFTPVEARWATQNTKRTALVTQRAVIERQTFLRRNHRHVTPSTTGRHRQQLKDNAACGILETLALWTLSFNAWAKLTTCQSSCALLQPSQPPSIKAQHHRRKTRKSGRSSAMLSNKCGKLARKASIHQNWRWQWAANTECTAAQLSRTLKSFCAICSTRCTALATLAGRRFHLKLTMRWGELEFFPLTSSKSFNFICLFSDLEKANVMWDWYTKRENSVIKDLFVGQLKSSLHCTHCEKTSVMYDPFWDLSVPVPSTPNCKLDKCLEMFTVKDVLDGNEMPYCDVSFWTILEPYISLTINKFLIFSIVKLLENALRGSQFNVSQNI